MKINWRVRLHHKPFLVGTFSLLLLLIQQTGAIFGYDTTIYNERVTDIFNTLLALLVLFGVVSDPTTPGMNDSERALKYDKSKGDE
ncbi:phage holin [Lysinibacillus sp. F5]|uniref:phage holin n=1 Tax=Lysinibacillus sp. F5 TaxID=1700846 RepID=UPI000738AFD6|nr:phage holin [Lysinibacillus sp. F5]KUF37455.1 holin [Lysinibacillus sp. F5]